jgi:YfiH family protein
MIEIALGTARAVFTTRRGGDSTGPYASRNLGRFTDDDRATVDRNLAALRAELGVDQLQMLHQVHGAEVKAAQPGELLEADGAFTDAANIGLLVTGADCPPVVLAGPGTVAVVHGGWRPVAAGIVERAAAIVGSQFEAAIGPGICQRHFEVGPEVIAAIGDDAVAAAEGRQLDLAAVIATKLRRAGAASVELVDRCTYCEPDEFFSHRRDGGVTGRQAGVAWLA